MRITWRYRCWNISEQLQLHDMEWSVELNCEGGGGLWASHLSNHKLLSFEDHGIYVEKVYLSHSACLRGTSEWDIVNLYLPALASSTHNPTSPHHLHSRQAQTSLASKENVNTTDSDSITT
ncbi:hypothetical protein DMENIID0001_026030 [Sergentomyia squamirostris]